MPIKQFIASLRRIKTTLSRIEAIQASSWQQFLDVKVEGKVFGIFHQFDDLHDFIARVKAANPNADIKGC